MPWSEFYEEIMTLLRKHQDGKAAALIEKHCRNVEPTQRREQIACLYAQAMLHFRRSEIAEAEVLTKKALALAEHPPVDIYGKIQGLLGIAVCFWRRGSYPQMEQLTQEALSLSEQLGDDERIGESLHYLGNSYYVRGELGRAEQCYQRSLAIAQELDHKFGMITMMGALANVYRQQGDWKREEVLLRQRIDLIQQSPDQVHPYWVYGARFRFALRQVEEGIIDAATEEQEEFRRAVSDFENPFNTFVYHFMSGRLHLAQHNLKDALDQAWQAKSASSLTDLEDQVAAIQLLLRILLELYLLTNDQKHRTQLESLVEELLATSKQHSLQAAYIEGLLIAAFLRRAAFDMPGATELLERVEQLAEEYGLRPLQERAHQELTTLQEQLTLQQQLHDQFPKAYEQAQMREMMSYLQGAQKLIRREEL